MKTVGQLHAFERSMEKSQRRNKPIVKSRRFDDEQKRDFKRSFQRPQALVLY